MDEVVHNAATEAQLNRADPARSAAPRTAAAAAVAADPGQVGQWGPVVNWPVVGIHVALLPNGKVLAWDSVGDPATETFPVQTSREPRSTTRSRARRRRSMSTRATTSSAAGFAHLSDGSLFIAGGNKDQQLNGIVQTHLFNPATNTWSLGPDMAAGRWYPSVTPLTNDEMLITEGGPGHPGGAQDRRQPAGAEHGVAQPAALSLARRGARRSGLLLRARSDAAQARPGRGRLLAELRPARRHQPQLRQPRGLRHRQDRSSPAAARRRTTRA